MIDVTHFDSTFVNRGQTKDHAYVVKSLEVQEIVVVVNKLDEVDWNPNEKNDYHRLRVEQSWSEYYHKITDISCKPKNKIVHLPSMDILE